jgi:hypothetical protein
MVLLAGTGGLLSCNDRVFSPEELIDGPAPPEPSFAISDAVHGEGNPDFFFLPPLVPDPTEDPDFDRDGFNSSLAPIVEICEAKPETGCLDTQPPGFPLVSGQDSFDPVRLAGDHYHVNWHTKRSDLDAAKTYRIRVIVAGTELGFADVDVVKDSKELRNVDANTFIPLQNGRTLPIKFRIEKGAVFVVGPGGGVISAHGGAITLDVPPKALEGPVGITILSTTGFPPIDNPVPGTGYELGPDGTTFDPPALLTVGYDETLLPGPEAEYVLELYKTVEGVWARLPEATWDRDANSVSAPISGFSFIIITFRPYVPPAVIEVTETITVTDMPELVPPAVIEVAETITVTDVPEVLPPAVIEVTETITVTDVPEVLPPAVIQVAEIITVKEAVEVVGPAVASVEVEPAATTLPSLGATAQLTATARDAAGVEILGKSFEWESSDDAVASVGAFGAVTAVANGSALITATVDGVSGTSSITVNQSVASVAVTPEAIGLSAIGATGLLSAEARDANENPILGITFAWNSGDPSVAIVDDTGLVTASGPGVSMIRATGPGGVFGEATVSVDLGVVWTSMESGTSTHLRAIWGSSDSDIFAVGDEGTILHFDGSTWSPMASGTTDTFRDIWGTSSSDVFAVGESGRIVHFDGQTWTTTSSGTIAYLWGVWGTSSDNVYAVGYNGTILNYDGSAWTETTSGEFRTSLIGIWGTSATDIYAVGGLGTVVHYDGTSWTEVTTGTSESLWRLWGTSPSDIYVSGHTGVVLHFNGNDWAELPTGTTDALFDIWGTSSSDIFTVGGSGYTGSSYHYNGSAWSNVTPGSVSVLYRLWGTPSSDVYTVGADGTILRGTRVGS